MVANSAQWVIGKNCLLACSSVGYVFSHGHLVVRWLPIVLFLVFDCNCRTRFTLFPGLLTINEMTVHSVSADPGTKGLAPYQS